MTDRQRAARAWLASPALVPALLLSTAQVRMQEPAPQLVGGNAPPTVRSVGLAPGAVVSAGSDLRLRIEVDDPDGDAVSLRLLNPPSGLAFAPLRAEPSPAAREATWTVLGHSGGWQHLVFEADDGQATTRFVLPVRVEGDVVHASQLVGDVTGDGVLDLVVGASQAVVDGVRGAGAVYVWPGGPTVATGPATTLRLAQPSEGDQLGLVRGPGLQLVDVTGDGVLDVVVGGSLIDVDGVADVGAIAVWAGGPALASGTPAPWLLRDPVARPGDCLGTTSGLSIVIEDVTGDGLRDIVAGSLYADVGQREDRGAVLIFQGGPAGLADGRPVAKLVLPDGLAHEVTGVFGKNDDHQGIQVAELTGDALLDVLVVTPLADTPIRNTGAIYLWKGRRVRSPAPPLGEPFSGGPGGPGSSGASGGPQTAQSEPTRFPTAVLLQPGARDQDAKLGSGPGPSVRTEDVTGDGIADLIAAAPGAVFGSARGAAYVWRGGPTLSGTPAARATLKAPNDPVNSYLLGGTIAGHGLLVEDVTGDGVRDVVGVETNRDRIFVWRGGATLTGTPAARAELKLSPSTNGVGRLGDQGTYLVDLNGDGFPDIVSGDESAGLLGVWFGGPGLSGTKNQSARLYTVQNLGGSSGHTVRFEDWTQDGVPDVLLCGARSDSTYLWDGSTLSGDVLPTATWVGPGDYAGMGSLDGGEFFGQSLFVADVTGDGVLDAVVAAQGAARGGLTAAGAAYVLAGGAGSSGTLAPTTVLARATPAEEDQLGYLGSGQGLLLADLDDSGVLDVVLAGAFADGGQRNEGLVLVWTDGAAGDPAPPTVAWAPGPQQAGALLGFSRGQGLLAADLSGDGRLELVVCAQLLDDPEHDAGAVFLGSLGASSATFTKLSVPGASAGDQLGG